MVRLQLRASTRRLSTSAACARPVRRSLLYVPAHAQRLSKLGHLVAHAGTDALALDLEDSVPEHAKAHGRSLVLEYIVILCLLLLQCSHRPAALYRYTRRLSCAASHIAVRGR